MAELASLIVEVVLCAWPSVSERGCYVCNLEENLDNLKLATDNLESDYEVIKTRVEHDEKLPRKRTKKVASWLNRVEKLKADLRKTLEDGEVETQNKCFCGRCPKNCWSSYKLGKKVLKLINEADKLKVEFNIHSGLVDLTLKEHVTVTELYMGEAVGLDSMLQKVWDCIEDPTLGVIGLYGIRGVGKTTLLKGINNEFLKRSHDFQAVIWVPLTKKKLDVHKFQESILQALGISSSKWENTSIEAKASHINFILEHQKFVLLIDNVSDGELDLRTMGVPPPDNQNKSKIIFTARSEQVCGLMEAQRNIKVECLNPEQALDLFRKKVTEATLNSDPSIPELAKDMASECKGLPLTLVTVGRAMAVRRNLGEWKTSISIMKGAPSEISGMSKVIHLLKFSFDSLQNATLKSCFTYCYIFPESYKIRKEQLIEHWRREGYLGGNDFGDGGTHHARGEYYIGSLKQECLLESDESEEFVRVHDVIYGLDLWESKEKIVILTHRGAYSNQTHRSRDWKKVERISLWDDDIQDLPINGLGLSNLQTLLCKFPTRKQFPSGFFRSMPALRILDLSDSFDLSELPGEIGDLIYLEYLNLSRTAVVELPIVLQKLKKMKFLILDYMDNLQEIPWSVISEFQSLEVFSSLVSSNKRCSAECLLENLEIMQHVSEISIAIENPTFVQRLLRSKKLQQCIRKISLFCCETLTTLELSPSSLRKLEHLEFFNCTHLSELKVSPGRENHCFVHLCNVWIVNVQFSDVTLLLTYAPNLETLTLIDCKLMEEVVLEVQRDTFRRLKSLRLEDLPCLKSICPHALPFCSLTNIEVLHCPRLKKLPFDSNSEKNRVMLITGERSWWDALRWVDEAIKQDFSSAFVEK